MNTDPLTALEKAGIDLGDLPYSYLEQYPYPALVLIFGVPLYGEIHASQWSLENIQPLSPVWTNTTWKRFTGNRQSLLQCLTPSSARRLSLWLTGQTDAASFVSPSVSVRSGSSSGEPARSPDETQQPADTTGPTLTLEFRFGSSKAKLMLAKTVQPVYRIGADGVRKIVRTHEAAIVTTMPSGQVRLQLPSARRRSFGTSYDPIPEDDIGGETPPSTDKVPLTSISSESPSSLLSYPSSDPVPPRGSFIGTTANGRVAPSSSGGILPRQSSSTSHTSGPMTDELDGWSARAASSSKSAPISLPGWRPGQTIELNQDGTARAVKSVFGYGENGADDDDDEGDKPPEASSKDVAHLLETTKWADTPLGKRKHWPESLQMMVAIIMRWPTPLAFWWGKDLVFIYNQKYADRLPNHPRAFGQSGTVAWAELWPHLGRWTEAALDGTPVIKDNDLSLYPSAAGDTRRREFYRRHQWVPVTDGEGTTALVHSWRDTTRDFIIGRRDRFLTNLALRGDQARTQAQHERELIDAFENNPTEAPFALIYRVESEQLFDSPNHFKAKLKYAGGVGVPSGHPSAPATLELSISLDGSERGDDSSPPSPGAEDGMRPVSPMPRDLAEGNELWPFAEALQTHRPVVVQDCFSRVEGYAVRVWDELPSSAVVIPICRRMDRDVPRGVVVLGISSANAYDEDYAIFVDDLHMLLTNSLGAVLENETQRVLQAEIQAAERAREALLTNVSHKLLTPLSLISGPLEDLAAEQVALAPAVRDALHVVQRNVSRLTRLVNMLVADSALEGRRNASKFGRVNLGQLTQNVAKLFAPVASAEGIDFVVECDEASRPVFVDLDKYERVLFVLIGNAIKFSPGGRVALTLRYTDTEVVVTVEDTGSGISPSVLDEIAGAPLAADGVTRRLRDSTGIGLSHADKLVNLHHGTLSVKSSTTGDKGTTFTLTLRLGSDHLPLDSVDSSPVETTGIQQIHQALIESLSSHRQLPKHELDPRPPTGMSVSKSSPNAAPYFTPSDVVMIVDNDPDSSSYLRTIFSVLCQVVLATDGVDALAKVKDRAPDLIIADAVLPTMDGYALAAALKNGTREEQMVPIILLTSRADAHEGVADDFLAKPFHSRELIARARMHIQWGKKRQSLEAAFLERTAEIETLNEIGIFRTTEDGWVVYVNKTWHVLSSYPQGQPVISWGDYIIPEDREYVRRTWTEFLNSNDDTVELEFTWINGTTNFAIATRLKPINGTPPGILGCLIDITDRVQKEALQKDRLLESEQRRIEAVEAKRQQEELIDITNLVTLQREIEEATQSDKGLHPTSDLMADLAEDLEALDSIYQCALTQERISNDVLSLGKIQMNTLEIKESEYAVQSEAHRLVSTFQSEARANKLELLLDLGSSFDRLRIHSVYLDPVRFGQVVTNLVSNAVRFTSTSPVRRVQLSLDIGFRRPEANSCTKPPGDDGPEGGPVSEHTPLYLFATVSDTGPGMTPADTEALFKRFTHEGSDKQTVFGGIGLGLFVCRKLTELMGGRIEVESVYGQGTTFNFFVQVRPRLNRPKLPPKTPSKATKLQCKARVLVVEDNVINCKVLCRQLGIAGATVQSVVNGLEAWNLLSETQKPGSSAPFDCVLMDLEMPVMDGYTATRLVREAEATGALDRTVVVALTGNARQAQIESAMADFDAVIVKPYRLGILLRVIEVSADVGSDVPGDRVKRVAEVVGQSGE
ncbi:Sensor histidine kinase TmoS [Vanrija pseudolonga]|uniref:Sensor histidine kinase TmoS n=1 Tax=Vanrija pseudolonga TaxID=143232 RepID=A0AAF1BQZ3_9TREE|nr:Sensor histidine kinase TmoS [Vanrija pseudolonga]